ncbi:MAG: four helix bundle protein [candidate division WOR-3 bacterium]
MKSKGNRINHFRELDVYRLAFDAAMTIFRVTKTFPCDEKFSLSDQIRRSSRSVCSNVAEAWRKRKYRAFFVNKLTDAMSEASETQSWLEFSFACEYIDEKLYNDLDSVYELIIAKLNRMERKADTFCYRAS